MNMNKNIETSKTRNELGRFLGGHPGTLKRYQTAEAIQSEIVKYFDQCEEEKKKPTMTGLALALGFKTRQALFKYKKEPGYEFAFDAIAFAKLKLEEYYEQGLTDPKNFNIGGTVFIMKNNFDWVDKQEIKMDQRTVQLTGFKMTPPPLDITDASND